MSDDQFHHTDPLPKEMPDYGRELFGKFSQASNGYPVDAILSASVNMIVQALREFYGKRNEVEERIKQLFGKCMELTMKFYDSTTNRRRSTIPFTQRLVMPLYKDPDDIKKH